MSQIIDRVEGNTKFLVASNCAFEINATGLIGQIYVEIQESGFISGTDFGSAAQLPGKIDQTTFVTNHYASPIYTAERRTARHPGRPIDQAVLVSITYSNATHPTFIFEPKAIQS